MSKKCVPRPTGWINDEKYQCLLTVTRKNSNFTFNIRNENIEINLVYAFSRPLLIHPQRQEISYCNVAFIIEQLKKLLFFRQTALEAKRKDFVNAFVLMPI